MNYELIQKRAESIYECIEENISNGFGMDESNVLDGLKASFGLKCKSVTQFIRAFDDCGTFFDITKVEEVYRDYSYVLEGPGWLCEEERFILEELQEKVSKEENVLNLFG